jgi:hypothetical protein
MSVRPVIIEFGGSGQGHFEAGVVNPCEEFNGALAPTIKQVYRAVFWHISCSVFLRTAALENLTINCPKEAL